MIYGWLFCFFFQNAKQGHLAFTVGLEDYNTYQQCALNVRYLRNRFTQNVSPHCINAAAVKAKMMLCGEVKSDVSENPFHKSRISGFLTVQTWPPRWKWSQLHTTAPFKIDDKFHFIEEKHCDGKLLHPKWFTQYIKGGKMMLGEEEKGLLNQAKRKNHSST